ncbi:MAG: SAM-dependent chlorinase/fluorinase [Deltaproteobacteria bacterium]|nr:SAM-dependent chlorinase/fluorinase [Deltaproteobacteria bacterium]
MGDKGIITLLTDFGWGDGYIGAMKGVILRINPRCLIVDVAHEISPHDVMGAALVLGQIYPYFPQGTIHVVVVDPGVGGVRKPLVLETKRYLFVGPDNGVFDLVLKREKGIRAYKLIEKRFFLTQVSQTFHGRDIFAPVAAHLSLGVLPGEMGPALNCEDLAALNIPSPLQEGETLQGEVIYIDHFGNLITNISQEVLREFAPDEMVKIEIGTEEIKGLTSSYAEGGEGEIIALWGSGGFLEISLKERSLHRERGWVRGERVKIRRRR